MFKEDMVKDNRRQIDEAIILEEARIIEVLLCCVGLQYIKGICTRRKGGKDHTNYGSMCIYTKYIYIRG